MKQIKLKYGIKSGELVHISEVESGLACSCICVSCHETLVAKKGMKRENHFAHASGHSCEFAAETALHLAAKEVLNKHRKIMLPPAWIEFDTNRGRYQISDAKSVTIDSLKIETKIDTLIPDLIATVNGRDLLIEIFVTHAIDEEKTAKIEQLGISTIEIDLSKAPRDMSMESLKEVIIDKIENKRWIYNARVKSEFKRMLNQTKHMDITSRGFASHVDYCPIKVNVWRGKPYANVIDDCIYCIHCVSYPGDVICCNGHLDTNDIYKPKLCT